VSSLVDTDVDSFVVDDFMFLSGQARDAAFMSTEREIRRLQALQAGRIRHTETTCGFVDDAFHSITSWLQAVTNVARGSASFRVGVARLLEDMPLLASAGDEGRIGDDQLRLLVRLHTNDRCRPHMAESDALLTGHAASLTLRDFRQVCQRWESWADPDGTQRDHELSHANRSIKIAQTGTEFMLTAQGSAVTGEELEQIIQAHEQAEYEIDIAQRADRYGDQANQYPLARTARQRRFDAFVAVMLKGAATDQPGHVAATVNLVSTPDQLDRMIRTYLGGDTITNSSSERLRMCETVNGTPVSDRELLIAALTGQIRRVITDSAGRVIDLGRRQRLFTGAAREAVKLFGDRCCWPGCEHNLGDMHLDHLEAFAANGTTDPNNGAVMCPAHNQAKEHHKIRVKRDAKSEAAGGWHHYRRDGTEITPRDG
jgi:hypothetical protein